MAMLDLPENNDFESTDQPAPPVGVLAESGDTDSGVTESIADDPIVRELSAQLAKCEEMEAEFVALVQPAIQAASEVEQEIAAMRERFNEELRLKSIESEEIRKTARALQTQRQETMFLKQRLQRELQAEIDRQMAERRKTMAEQQFNTFLDEHGWFWADKVRPYQMSGIKFLAEAKTEELHGRASFDQMGLGKTLQAAAVLDILQAEHRIMCPDCQPSHFSVLWLCPAAIKDTSKAEIAKWSPDRPVAMLQGNPAHREAMVTLAHQHGMSLVVNYETLRTTPAVRYQNFAQDKHGNIVDASDPYAEPEGRVWPIVILDEAHRFKNDDSQVFKFVETICKNADLVIPMTGTPIMNRPEEFWAILHMLTLKGKFKGKFARKERFVREYCYQYGNEVRFQSWAADELMKECSNMVIRRTKDEVLKDLPPKIGGITRFKDNPDELVRYVTLEGEQRRLYDMMRDRFYVWLDEQKMDALSAPVVIAQFTRLRQLALYPAGVKVTRKDENGDDEIEQIVNCTESAKFDECMNLLDEIGVAEGEKVLIFTSYESEVIDALKSKILAAYPAIEVGRITGKEDSAKKQAVQTRFVNPDDDMRVVIGTTRAAGIGLNLQGACSNVIFLDLDWNPGIIEQAEDRVHRIGQLENVQIHTIQAESTIDAYIMHKLMNKIDMISGVVDRRELRQAFDDGLI